MHDIVRLPYGRGRIEIKRKELGAEFSLIEPAEPGRQQISMEDLRRALENAIGSRSLKHLIQPGDRVCIVTGDGTRPSVLMRFVLHGVFEHLGFIPEKTVVLTGSGSHQPHTEKELRQIFCRKLYESLTVIAHDARSGENIEVGRFPDGTPVTMNRHYVEADKRIVVGHVEPHFFTGFTGGAKGIVPAIGGIETIHRIHSHEVIADPSSRYGNVEGNKSIELIQAAAAECPPDFLINVVLDKYQKPIGAFAGDYMAAHGAAVEFCRKVAVVEVDKKSPIAIVSNGGWPLDQNLYQTVKGIDAARMITEPGGAIITVSECRHGIPSGSSFERMLQSPENNETLLGRLSNDREHIDDRWQVQRLLQIMQDFQVSLISSLDEDTTCSCRLAYAPSIVKALQSAYLKCDCKPHVAMVPYGPQTLIEITG